jgi:hypothetical protein
VYARLIILRLVPNLAAQLCALCRMVLAGPPAAAAGLDYRGPRMELLPKLAKQAGEGASHVLPAASATFPEFVELLQLSSRMRLPMYAIFSPIRYVPYSVLFGHYSASIREYSAKHSRCLTAVRDVLLCTRG